jgi:hypothetical protein
MNYKPNEPDGLKNVEVGGSLEARFTPEFLKDVKTGQQQEHTRESRRFIVEIATLCVVFVYTTLAFWQGCSNQKAANAARESAETNKLYLTAVQRAFMYVNGFTIYNVVDIHKPGAIAGFTLAANLRNSGSTPAIDATYHLNRKEADQEIDNNFKFPDFDLARAKRIP